MELSRRDGAENRLVARARAGNAAAFGELVRRHDAGLCGRAFRLLEDREGMDDVLQEVYLKAFRALPGFRGHSAFGTWLTGSLLEQPSRRASARRDR